MEVGMSKPTLVVEFQNFEIRNNYENMKLNYPPHKCGLNYKTTKRASQKARVPHHIYIAKTQASPVQKKKSRRRTRNQKGKLKRKTRQMRDRALVTWPPTTAIVGSESHSVGSALSSPWSPRAVHARWSLLTREMRFSMASTPETLGGGGPGRGRLLKRRQLLARMRGRAQRGVFDRARCTRSRRAFMPGLV
jgi:hypothetical protein